MQLSDVGLRFIADWEGKRNALYDDGGPGRGNATIGVGHLVHYGPIDGRPEEFPYQLGLSDDECYALLREDAARFEASVNQYLRVTVNQNQFDALCDLAFNAGMVPSVFTAVNNGWDVCGALRQIVHDGNGNVIQALVDRREADCELFNRPVEEERVYDDATIDGKFLKLIVLLRDELQKGVGAIAQANAGSFKGIEDRLTALEAKGSGG